MDKFAFENVLIDAFNEYGKDGEFYVDTPGMSLKFGMNRDTFAIDTSYYILTIQLHISLADDAELVKEFNVKWYETNRPQGLVNLCQSLFNAMINRYQNEMSKLYKELHYESL